MEDILQGQMDIFDYLPDCSEKIGGGTEPSDIQLFNGDCYEMLKNIADNSIDLVVIDPPYKFTTGGVGGAFGVEKRNYHKTVSKNEMINNGIDNVILDELVRIMKKINIYIWCSKDQLRQYIDYFENIGCKTDLLTWHKTNPVPTCNNKYLSDTEYCFYFRRDGVALYGKYETKKKYYVTPTNKQDKELYHHPTIKPLNIIENLIINSSNEGDVVLDCFMGSGTTGVAAKKLNRRFIGIEISEEYFKTAKERIENARN